jgi:hypothetical protein
MKKLLAILAITLVSGTVSAASVTIEGQGIDNSTGNDAMNMNLTVRGSITPNFSGHFQVSNTQTDNTNAIANRLEAGVTAQAKLLGPVSGYTTVAVGQMYKATGNFAYYSVEPGLSAPIGSTGLTAKVGYRYRSAMQDAALKGDTTETVRAGVSYALTKQDAIGVRYDKVTGDAKQNVVAVNYTRSF